MIVVVKKDFTIEPIRLAGDIVITGKRSINGSLWFAHAYAGEGGACIATAMDVMPDRAVEALRMELTWLRDALIEACDDDVAPGCGGEDMMPIEADEEAA